MNQPNTTRRFGGSAPAGTTPAPVSSSAAIRHTAAPAQPAGPRVPSFARGATLPPANPNVDTTNRGEGGGEKRDQAYWDAHPLRPGTYDLDVYMSQAVDWSTGRLTITLQVSQWDRDANRPGEHHQRRIDWDHSRPDLLTKLATLDPQSEEYGKAERGYAYWRADMVGAYTAAGLPEEKWPRMPDGSVLIPWWDLLTHTCPDGVIVPVMLRARIVVEPKREKWPKVQAVVKLLTEQGKPFQAPMPYAMIPAAAQDFRWQVAEVKQWGNERMSAQVGLINRESVAFPHAGLPTYKDL